MKASLSVSLNIGLAEQVRRLAEAAGMSVSAFVSLRLREAVAAAEAAGHPMVTRQQQGTSEPQGGAQ